jgi:formate transporter
VHQLGDGAVGATALAIGHHKAALGCTEAIALGVLCNALVCLAVWLTMGGRTVTDKVLAIVFPITAFVTMGLEHSIANMFFLPYALVLQGFGDAPFIAGALRNLVAVTLGNLLGGTVLVAGVYWLAYLRGEKRLASPGEGRRAGTRVPAQ